MIYPQNFEQKIGFDEIRTLLTGHCLSTLGIERVVQMKFLTDTGIPAHSGRRRGLSGAGLL